MSDTTTVPPHPAKFSRPVLDKLNELLVAEADRTWPDQREDYDEPRVLDVLDPFGGVGGIHDLAGRWQAESGPFRVATTAVELEPEWAAAHPDTEVGDALALRFDTGAFPVVATSPCYGNRMADHHEAKDPCKECNGLGCTCPGYCEKGGNTHPDHTCPVCKGSGLSKRNTYRHQLGRMPSDNSAAVMAWGTEYRTFHDLAAGEMIRVADTDGLVLVNMSNHLTNKGQVEHHVTEWWINTLLYRGCRIAGVYPVATRRQRQGQNGQHRTECEFIIAVRTPRDRRLL